MVVVEAARRALFFRGGRCLFILAFLIVVRRLIVLKNVFALIALFALVGLVAAQSAPEALKASVCSGVNLMRYIVGALALLAIMWNGAKLIPFTGGEVSAEDREGAKKGIIWSVAGALIVILAPSIVGYFLPGIPVC